ncbi:MAG: arginine decarboxylase, partial [Algisphaera sp.]
MSATPHPATKAPTTPEEAAHWPPARSAALYGVDRWGAGYVSVSDTGTVRMHPDGNGPQSPGVDLKQLVDELRQRDLATPLLIRFPGIIGHRLKAMSDAFASAIKEFDFAGDYRGVYPIKVNQQRHIVEDLLAFGAQHNFGLEAGSKPELLAVLALADDPDTLVICNGFKDAQFIEAVILAQKVGRNVIPVVEKYSEIKLIIEQAKVHGVQPKIGVRIKL